MNKAFLLFVFSSIPFLTTISVAQAQEIVPDTTLPENTLVEVTDNVGEITGGTTRGTNLFHSFQTFNLNPADTAFFNNSLEITNILGRITGGDPSSIDGLIRTNGDANLFLINPAGIVFGENASLDVGGTFTATSADSILFEDGEFNAVNPAASILSVNLPTGAQLGEAAPVTVFGKGSNLFWDDFAETIYDERPDGLSNANGINLVGSDININGGNVTSEEGLVNLTAASNGSVNFAENSIIPDAQTTLGDINIANAASVSTTAEGSGIINLYGANAYILDGSALLSQNYDEGAVGSININLSGDLEILGENQFGDFPSYVSTDVLFTGISQGGDINIDANNVSALLGGQANAATFGDGNGGNLNINATDVYASSGGSITSSAFLVDSAGPADAGELNVNADIITIEFGAQLGSSTYFVGKGGTVNLNAQEINVLDREDLGDGLVFPSQITSNTNFEGDGGDINIDTESLTITDGGQVFTSTIDFGNAGNIKINASTINIEETYPNDTGVDTGIISGSGNEFATEDALGLGGNIDISANEINLTDGGLISAGTLTASSGGDITINTTDLNLSANPETETEFSGGVISNRTRSTGGSGSIEINAQNIDLDGGSQINVGTVADGDAGSLKVNTDSLKIAGFSEDGSSALLSTALIGSGSGGTVEVNAKDVEVKDGGTISASNFSTRNTDLAPGTGAAGTILINTENLTVANEEPTSINASTNAGGGGSIEVNASQNINVNGSEAAITTQALGSSDGGNIALNSPNLNLNQGTVTSSAVADGNAGDINLNTNEINASGGQIVAESQVAGGGDVNINSDNITLNDNSLISTSVEQSDGGGGDITITNTDIILTRNDSDIRANAEFGPGGNIEIATDLLFRDPTSDIDASSNFGLDGVVQIDRGIDEEIEAEPLSEKVEDPSKLITAICPVGDDNVFAVTGRGGIPQKLQGNLSSSSTSEVIGTPQASSQVKVQAVNQTAPIKEANGIYTTAQGFVVIAHNSSMSALQDPWYKVASCSK